MPHHNIAIEKLQKLKTQQATLTARIQLLEARGKTHERKQETRRKILVGSYYLDLAKQNEAMDDLKKIMTGYLKRNSDRKLFDLAPLAEEKTK